ncbi:MAG: acyl-ACP--UDP-N-acetylglucosamine O-acyltransferase [candidate division Zixibacteria bacterium]|nr:acyl-ACP--UDP-N-acetylglucosamine O-acyltransferase [candidate division Zixibacteria bacterium]
MDIHPTAIIHKDVKLADDVCVGPFSIINEGAEIGGGTEIGSHVLIDSGTIIGRNCKIHHGAVLGTLPQDLKFQGEKTFVTVGDDTVIREYATINRGTEYRGKSVVGKDCFIMAYAHIAHDCLLGDHVILANSVNLAGHIEIGDFAIIGGVVPVHQFVKIGAHSIVGGGFRVQKDVCPYALVAGYPLKTTGLNRIGLQRRGFSEKTMQILEKTFRVLFKSKLNTSQAIERIKTEVELVPEVQTILDFIVKSERGIIK